MLVALDMVVHVAVGTLDLLGQEVIVSLFFVMTVGQVVDSSLVVGLVDFVSLFSVMLVVQEEDSSLGVVLVVDSS